jgi:hypothetical protein
MAFMSVHESMTWELSACKRIFRRLSYKGEGGVRGTEIKSCRRLWEQRAGPTWQYGAREGPSADDQRTCPRLHPLKARFQIYSADDSCSGVNQGLPMQSSQSRASVVHSQSLPKVTNTVLPSLKSTILAAGVRDSVMDIFPDTRRGRNQQLRNLGTGRSEELV